ncbi:hypothetical protein VCHENC02_3596A, partial [Vibrio harveyi]
MDTFTDGGAGGVEFSRCCVKATFLDYANIAINALNPIHLIPSSG